MALSESEKILFQKFHRRFRNMENIAWQGITMVSRRPNENEVFGIEREAAVEVSTSSRTIVFTYSDALQDLMDSRSIIYFREIDSTFSPSEITHMLRLENGQEVKITFGSPAGKSSFIDAITLASSDSSDSGNSET